MKLLLVKAMREEHLYTGVVNSLARALSEIGHEAIITDQAPHVDHTTNSAPAKYLAAELEAARYDAVISISSFYGAAAFDGGRSIFDVYGVKFVGWQFDHPIYAPQSLAPVLKNRYSIYSSRNHLRWADAMKLPGCGMTMLPGADAGDAPPKDYKSRDWPIFVVATYRGEPQRLWEQAEDSAGKRLLTGVIDELMGDRELSLIDAFNRTSANLGLGARLGDDPAFDAMIGDFLREPLTYLRNSDRLKITTAIVEAGLPVTLCGSGWETYFGQRKNVTYLEGLPFVDCLRSTSRRPLEPPTFSTSLSLRLRYVRADRQEARLSGPACGRARQRWRSCRQGWDDRAGRARDPTWGRSRSPTAPSSRRRDGPTARTHGDPPHPCAQPRPR